MGLDMYLHKKTYVRNWNHMGPEERTTLEISGPRAVGVKPERVAYVVEEVGYWRKANAIHAWFVDHCQGGEDDCREAPVSREQLRELLALVTEAMESQVAPPELQPRGGFFFGSTEIDADYWADLADTQRILSEVLDDPGQFTYTSSW